MTGSDSESASSDSREALLAKRATFVFAAGPPSLTLADCYNRAFSTARSLELVMHILGSERQRVANDDPSRKSAAYHAAESLIKSTVTGLGPLTTKLRTDWDFLLKHQAMANDALLVKVEVYKALFKINAPTFTETVGAYLDRLVQEVHALEKTVPGKTVTYASMVRAVSAATQPFLADYRWDKNIRHDEWDV